MGLPCLKVPWWLFKTDIRGAESLITWLEKSGVLLKQDPCTWIQKEQWEHVGEGGKQRLLALQLPRRWTGEFWSTAIQFSHLHHTQSTFKGLSVVTKCNSLTQWLILKGSTCFEPTGTWAPSPDLSHPSISVKCSTARLVPGYRPSLELLPITSKGSPNIVHFVASMRNDFQLSILKYLWPTVKEQWHTGNTVCFSTL